MRQINKDCNKICLTLKPENGKFWLVVTFLKTWCFLKIDLMTTLFVYSNFKSIFIALQY